MASAYEGDSSDDLRIVLLGVSGAGKSGTANEILGREAFKENRTRESEKQTGRVEDRNISIIDTPGFFNTQMADEELQSEMTKSLYLSHPGPHVFLLVINLETFKEEQRNIVEQIQKNFGAQAFKSTLVLFIRREKMSNREWMDIILNRTFQNLVGHCRGKYHVVNSNIEIAELLQNIDEIIKHNNNQHYNNDIYLKSLTKRRQKTIQEEEQDKENEQETAKKQEQKQIMWERFEMDSVTEGKTPKALTELEKQNNISHVIETERTQESLLEENQNEEENMIKQTAQSLTNLFEKVEDKNTIQTNSSKMSGTRKWSKDKTQRDLKIVILGKTGAGKSSAGNTILGSKCFKNAVSPESVTKTCERGEVVMGDRIISVIDTPGLFDTTMSADKMKEEMVKCVEMSVPGPHAFLLAIKVGRFTDEEKNTVKWIQDNFGEDAVPYIIILFTHADTLDNKPLNEYVRESSDLKALVDECGGRIHSFNNKDMGNCFQVTELLNIIDEMVISNGGQCYTNEMYQITQHKIKWEAWKKNFEYYGTRALAVGGALAVGAALVSAAGRPAAAASKVVEVAGGATSVAVEKAIAAAKAKLVP